MLPIPLAARCTAARLQSGIGYCEGPIPRLESPTKCVRVCVCVCLSLSMIRCNYTPLHLLWVWRKR